MLFAEALTRFGIGAALAAATVAVFVVARRRRPRSPWTFLWVAPFLLTVWSGWSTTSWGERYEYERECLDRWDIGVRTVQSGGGTPPTTFPAPAVPPPTAAPVAKGTFSKTGFMGRCIDDQRAHAERRRADPDSGCNWEDRSGCPEHDYRGLWLGTSFIAGGAGLLHSLSSLRRSAAPRS